MSTKRRIFAALAVLVLAILACNLPSAQTPTPDPNAALTVAAQTIAAQLTQNALLSPPATFAPLTASQTPAPATSTKTPASTLTPTPICDLVEFVSDVTVPDGTPFLPGEAFVKTWRLRNIGVCTWTTGYQIIFDNGEAMNGPVTQPMAGSVAPSQTVDVSVSFKAPANPGPYRGYWKLRNAAGVLVPVVNGYQGSSFFVDIKVVAPTATVTVTPTPTPTITPTTAVPSP